MCHGWLYWVFVGMICAQYAQICLPCIVAIMLVPVFCFCLPCFVRLLSAIHVKPYTCLPVPLSPCIL